MGVGFRAVSGAYPPGAYSSGRQPGKNAFSEITLARPRIRIGQAEQAREAEQASWLSKLAEQSKRARQAEQAKQAKQARRAEQSKRARQARIVDYLKSTPGAAEFPHNEK